jgi:hypothetical protein
MAAKGTTGSFKRFQDRAGAHQSVVKSSEKPTLTRCVSFVKEIRQPPTAADPQGECEMLKTLLIAASLLSLGASGAFAQQEMHHQYRDHSQSYNSPEAFTGVNRFCGPGQIPQSFPNGNGVRCELPSGGYTY